MKHYPIAIELTVWKEHGLDQYELTLDQFCTVVCKKTEDVRRERELSKDETDALLAAVRSLSVPVVNQLQDQAKHSDKSYELIIESAHFSLEINWEYFDIENDIAHEFESATDLADLIEKIGTKIH